jgi:LCP family protein required for cell wall assembly
VVVDREKPPASASRQGPGAPERRTGSSVTGVAGPCTEFCRLPGGRGGRWWLNPPSGCHPNSIHGSNAGGYAVVHHYTGRLGHTGIRLPGVAAPADTDGEAFQAAPDNADYVSGQRSDTVILVHLPAGAAKATLVSFPWDSYVQIPAHPDGQGHRQPAYPAKLNEAFAVGGPPLLVQLIENLSGLRIDHFVEVDFGGFKTMVDALGRVTLCVNTTRHDPDSGDMLTKGVHPDVDGADALAFVRDRKGLPNADLDRIADQQYFLARLLAKVTSTGTLANPVKLNAFLAAVTGNVTVDNALSLADLRSLATRLRHLDPAHVTFATILITNDSATRTIHGVGQSVVLIDTPKAAALFGQLRGDATSAAPAPPPAILPPAQVPVSVRNASGRPGLAAAAAAGLRAAGFPVASMGNTGASGRTVVRYGPGREAAARTVAAAVPAAELVPDSALTGTVVLVLGPDFTAVGPVGTPRSTGPPPPASSSAPPPPAGVTAGNQASCAP